MIWSGIIGMSHGAKGSRVRHTGYGSLRQNLTLPLALVALAGAGEASSHDLKARR